MAHDLDVQRVPVVRVHGRLERERVLAVEGGEGRVAQVEVASMATLAGEADTEDEQPESNSRRPKGCPRSVCSSSFLSEIQKNGPSKVWMHWAGLVTPGLFVLVSIACEFDCILNSQHGLIGLGPPSS